MNNFQHKGRRRLALVTALGVLAAVAVAGVAFAGGSAKEKACIGTLCFEGGGSFSPKKLSKTQQTPIALTVNGKITESDNSHPPALTKAIVETDKNGMINVKGYPVCKASKIQSTDTTHAEAACRPAIIGFGHANAEIKLNEQNPIPASSKVVVFNGGEKGGTTTLFIHAYITVPVPAAIVTTVKIKKIHHGRYGTEAIATIPPIASGNGSITSFNLTINKKFTYKGKKVSVLTAKCPDGRLQAHGTAYFADGTKLSTEFVKPCTGV